MADKFIALSYSRLSTYQQCPRKFKLQFLDKAFPFDGDNPAFVKGKNMHQQMEDYTDALIRLRNIPTLTLPSLDKHCATAAPIAEGLVRTYEGVYTEQQIAVNKDWERVEWFAKDVYYRCIDKTNPTAILVDWKSGKIRDYDHGLHGQLRLAAGVAMALYEHVQKVTTSYVFLEHQKTIPVSFKRDELISIREDFDEASAEVNSDESWVPKRNKYCNWCAATPDQCPNKKRSM